MSFHDIINLEKMGGINHTYLMGIVDLDKDQIIALLQTPAEECGALYSRADRVRQEYTGDAVFLRGIIEFSNKCAMNCLYCGIRAGNGSVPRYTMDEDEILETARGIRESKATTVVLQSGESPAFGDERFGKLIRTIKNETGLAITVSVGERSKEVYSFWKECGMDRYLLRFECSDPVRYAELHPDSTLEGRLRALRDLRDLGVQVGSGFLVGIPGEDVELLADNILLCKELELDMIGIGPFLAHPDTPLKGSRNSWSEQPEMLFKAVSVLRLANPAAHIPATTVFDSIFPGEGRNLVLQRGANVFMPNSTPMKYREKYLLYPDKPCVDETPGQCAACVLFRIESLGRQIGEGPGHALPRI